MPRPATKTDLIIAANQQFEKMWQLIDSMTEEEQNTAFDFGNDPKDKEAHWKRDKNLRDILVHLYEWHQLLLHWISANQKGDAAPFLPAPYNWKTYGGMNMEFWKKHQSTPYDEAKAMILKSHEDVLALAAEFTNEELFEKKHFTWSGSTNIGSYFISATSSHYEWAIKKIKRQLGKLRTNGL